MNFLAAWFPAVWLNIAHFILVLVLVLTAKSAWRTLSLHREAGVAACCIMLVLWSLRAGLSEGVMAGMNYHLLGIVLCTLMVGLPAAVWCVSLLMLPYAWVFYGGSNLNVLSLNVLVVLLPSAVVGTLIRYAAARFLPPHLFIYIFINGFFSAAVGMLATGVSVVLLLSQTDTFAQVSLWSNAFPVFFLITWGEAFLTGLLTAIFVVLVPQLLATFTDQQYLQVKRDIWQ